MSEIQEIEVFIQPDGTVKIEVSGVKGQKCLNLTHGIEEALGGKVAVREHKSEFYDNEQELDQNSYVNQFG